MVPLSVNISDFIIQDIQCNLFFGLTSTLIWYNRYLICDVSYTLKQHRMGFCIGYRLLTISHESDWTIEGFVIILLSSGNQPFMM